MSFPEGADDDVMRAARGATEPNEGERTRPTVASVRRRPVRLEARGDVVGRTTVVL